MKLCNKGLQLTQSVSIQCCREYDHEGLHYTIHPCISPSVSKVIFAWGEIPEDGIVCSITESEFKILDKPRDKIPWWDMLWIYILAIDEILTDFFHLKRKEDQVPKVFEDEINKILKDN